MIRTTLLVVLIALFAGLGCTRFQSRGQGPFARLKKEPPPPYGSAQRPVGGQSPLELSATDPAPPLPPDGHSLIPPKSNAPAGAPTAPTPAAQNLAQLKSLLATAGGAWNAVSTYETQLTRRELNPKGQINSEVIILQYRRDPMSVFTRNIAGSGKGRETVYNPGAHGDKLHVLLGEGDSKWLKAGTLAPAPISPDDPRVKEKARYSVREAGFGRPIAALRTAVAKVEAGYSAADSLVLIGEVKRDEYPYPLVEVSHKLRPGDDPLLLSGGMRLYFFDMKPNAPSFGMPVLVIAFDASGKEVEYYLSENVKNPAHLTEANFNPARLGK